MDIMIHILLLVLMGIFFFLDKYNNTNNSTFVVILLCIFAFGLTAADPTIEIVDYSIQTKTISTNTTTNVTTEVLEYDKQTITESTVGNFTMVSFVILMYFFFFILAILNFAFSKKS